uniref:Uncharacterized protein n=1 Tax=Anguilla anguilla TaxID=7936 RepID=A0A0E9T747_ANGAN
MFITSLTKYCPLFQTKISILAGFLEKCLAWLGCLPH